MYLVHLFAILLLHTRLQRRASHCAVACNRTIKQHGHHVELIAGPGGHQRLKGLLKEGRGGSGAGHRAAVPQRGSAAAGAATPASAPAAAPQHAAAGAQQQGQQPQQQRPPAQRRGDGGGGGGGSGPVSNAHRGPMAGKRQADAMAGNGSRGGGSRPGGGNRAGVVREGYAAASSQRQQQQRRPTAQRSIKRRDAGTIERCSKLFAVCCTSLLWYCIVGVHFEIWPPRQAASVTAQRHDSASSLVSRRQHGRDKCTMFPDHDHPCGHFATKAQAARAGPRPPCCSLRVLANWC